jgi:hypothetical protein
VPRNLDVKVCGCREKQLYSESFEEHDLPADASFTACGGTGRGQCGAVFTGAAEGGAMPGQLWDGRKGEMPVRCSAVI